MIAFWYAAVAAMLTVYVVLDGFDFGVGILHLFVARTDAERREVLASIEPVWDGNEVWLIASGGVLFLAFPRAYAAGFSGFYLPLMMVLWLLILRGISIELRSHLDNPLWRSFWDAVLALASATMAIVLGAALGNVLRGVPLDQTGFFHGPLFTDFRLGRQPGVLDWYTLLIGLFAFAALSAHGALYLAGRVQGRVLDRTLAVAQVAWPVVAVLGLVCIATTRRVRPEIYQNLLARPWSWPLVLVAAGGLLTVFDGLFRGRRRAAFRGSVAFLAGTLAATAAGSFPVLLSSTLGPDLSLTAGAAAAGEHGLRVGLAWWIPGILLAVGYTAFMYRSRSHGHPSPAETGSNLRAPASDERTPRPPSG